MQLFRPRWDLVENPRTGHELRALVLETPDWVNVVARDPEGQYVLVRQFRFGSGRVTSEIPGGLIEPGEPPLEAARRELLEETGYEAARWVPLGASAPNPAFHDNLCHHFLALDARSSGAQQQDPGEDILVVLRTEEELRAAVHSGELDHSLAISALCRVLDLRQPDDPS